jgi:manganese-dependent inorganic pyrophosphatase
LPGLVGARKNGVSILSTSFDTATAAGLAKLAPPLSLFVEKKFSRIGIGEPFEHLRVRLIQGGESAVIAVEEDGTLAGIATKSSFNAGTLCADSRGPQ